MGVLYARVGGAWVPIGAATPSFRISHYQAVLGANYGMTTTPTSILSIALPAAPAGSLLDISHTTYVTIAGPSGNGFLDFRVNGVKAGVTTVLPDPTSLMTFSGRTVNVAQPVGVAFNVELFVNKGGGAGTITMLASNCCLSVVSFQPT